MLFISYIYDILLSAFKHNNTKKQQIESELIMENKIVRECVQGLINDSKIVDKLSKLLDCHRTELEEKIVALQGNTNNNISLDTMKSLLNTVKDLQCKIESAESYADEAKSQADYAMDEAQDAGHECDMVIESIEDMMSNMEEEVEEAQEDLDNHQKQIEETQKEIDNSNQYTKVTVDTNK